MQEAEPTTGRIVHYVAYGTPGGEFPEGKHRAAIITDAEHPNPRGRVSLCVLNPTGMFFNTDVRYNVDHQPGTWHWPERAT